MPNIVLTRIDNRLIHGQVASMWCKYLDIDLMIVANDQVANDEFRQSLMSMAVPKEIETVFCTIQDTINKSLHCDSDRNIFIVCANPDDALKLIEGGLDIKKVNIGNMHMCVGKRQVATTVAIDDKDVECFKKMQDLGVELQIQRVPTVEQENIKYLFKK